MDSSVAHGIEAGQRSLGMVEVAPDQFVSRARLDQLVGHALADPACAPVYRQPKPLQEELTPDELAVMLPAAEGYDLPTTAYLLGISPGTVRKRRAQAHNKLGVSGVIGGIGRIIELGIVPTRIQKPHPRILTMPTPMQLRVLSASARGEGNLVIAGNREVSKGTVSTHLARARNCVDAFTTVEAIMVAYEAGLLPLRPEGCTDWPADINIIRAIRSRVAAIRQQAPRGWPKPR